MRQPIQTFSRISRIVGIALVLALCVACSSHDTGILPPILQNILKASSPCDTPTTITIQAQKITGNEIWFAPSDLKALSNPNLAIQSMTLAITMEHKSNISVQDITISVNGLMANSRDGRPLIGRDGDHDDDDRFLVPLDRISISGNSSMLSLMLKIFNNQGTLRISLDGKKETHIVAAEIDVQGTITSSCSPPPPPPPPPTAPVTTITAVTPSGSVINSTSISFTFSADQVNVNYACTLDGVTAACTSPQVYSGLSNGAHVFSVVATNSSGLSDVNPPTYNWSVDTVPPTITITPQATLTNSTSISLSFSSSESDVTSCSLDAAAPAPCTSPVTYSGISEGAHVIAITATDSAGNSTSTPATFAWTVDLTPPVTSIVAVTPTSSPTNQTQATIQFAANEGASFQCSLDESAQQPCTSPFTTPTLTEGNHTFTVQATDLAGNQGNSTQYIWNVDLTAPVITLGNVVPAPGTTNGHNISVEFTASEVATFSCSLDQQTAAACSSPFTANVDTEGPHSLVVTAIDSAGNLSVPSEVDWTMDYTDPSVSFGAILPSAASYVNSTQMSFEVNVTEPVVFAANLDGTIIPNATSPIVLTGLTEGSHTLSVTGFDDAGNPANTITHTFTVDLTPPVLTASATYSNTATNQTTNTINFATNEASTFQCQLDGVGFTACQSPVNVSGLAQGNHEFDIEAVDLAGNMSTVTAIQWSVDLTPPTTTLSATQTAADTMTFNFTSSETNSAFQCSLDGAAAAACSSPDVVSGLSTGSHTFTVQAIDAVGNIDPVGQTTKFTILPPVNTTISGVTPSASVTNQTHFTFTFTSNHPEATFRCSLDGATAISCQSPYDVTITANGQHKFLVQAVDGFGNIDPVGASYQFTVDTIAPVVTLTPVNLANPTNQTSATFAFSANETATFQCALDSTSFGSCQSQQNLTGLTEGTHTFNVVATDLAGNVGSVASYNWTVDLTAPTTSITTKQTARDAFTFTLNSSEANSSFQCSLDGGAFVSCISPVSYTGMSTGNHVLVAKAMDAAGNLDATGASANFTVQPPIATTITSVNPSTSTITQSSISFTFQANQSGATFLCSLDGAAATSCTSPQSYSGLANGNHQFVVKAVDVWGNVDPNGATYAFTVSLCQFGAPVISGVVVNNITRTSAMVQWTTDVPSSSQVLYTNVGTGAQTLTSVDSNLVTSHSITILGLTSNTVYSVNGISASCGGSTTSQPPVQFRTSR